MKIINALVDTFNYYNKPIFIMMVGLPGSGKSYIANEINKRTNIKIYSSDNYRLKLLGDENDQSQNEHVFAVMNGDMINDLMNDKDIIYDATNTTLKTRQKTLRLLEKLDVYKICVVVPTTVEDCVERDAKRTRTVGEAVIRKFEHSFQMPQYFEGWDKIIIERPFQLYGDYIVNVPDFMKGYDQKNFHHIYTLDKHCELLAQNYEDKYMNAAGLVHDIGKYFTQMIDENGVAHYYSHDNVGTYYLLTHPEVLNANLIDEIYLKILFFVNWHMRAHNDIIGSKAKIKYRKLFGDSLYNNLIEFANYDKIASGTDKGQNK